MAIENYQYQYQFYNNEADYASPTDISDRAKDLINTKKKLGAMAMNSH